MICYVCNESYEYGAGHTCNLNTGKPINRDPLLVEREKTHGSFAMQGAFAYHLKYFIHTEDGYKKLKPQQREAIDMIATKISRLIHGNPMKKDHWNDIAGYAKIGAEACD